jgi:hypothetical protein
MALKVAARSDLEIDRFEDALRGCASRPRPTVSAFVVGVCQFDFFELPEKLFGSRY